MPEEDNTIYRIIFTQENKLYQIYSKYISEETLMGFIEVDELLFNDASTVLLDASEERLKLEFKGVKRSYIPLHAIYRIDEVTKPGTAKIIELKNKREKIKNG